jgi:hypothetical protein
MNSNGDLSSKFAQHVAWLYAAGDNIKLFTEGCCDNFALRLHYARQVPFIEGCSDGDSSFNNVWLVLGNLAFDVSGCDDRSKFGVSMTKKYNAKSPSFGILLLIGGKWRRGRDSNPRNPCGFT